MEGSSAGQRGRERRGGGGRAGTGRTLTTGLARAELALEEARELELSWPPRSEGCPHSPPPGRRTETKGQGQQRHSDSGDPHQRPPLVEVSHVQSGKDRGEHGQQAPHGKEGCISKLQINAREGQKIKLVIISKGQNSWASRRK